MEIREACSDDYAGIQALLRQLNPDDPPADAAQQQAFDAILRASHLKLVVAVQDEVPVASCYLNIIPNMTRGARPYALIENVIVDSARRNRGIGSAVLRHALELAWQADCYKAMLMSGRTDPAVHAFYRACGFDSAAKQAYVKRAP